MPADIAADADRLAAEAAALETADTSLEAALRVEDLREDAAGIRRRITYARDHIRDYYGLDLTIGLRVTYSGRPGAVAGFDGQYVAVLLDGADEPEIHHTGSLTYPDGARVGPGPDERFAHLVQVPATTDGSTR